MKPRRIPKRDEMTAKANRIAAFTKVSTAPLHTLTEAMIDSIVRSHATERTRTKLAMELRATLGARKAREARA